MTHLKFSRRFFINCCVGLLCSLTLTACQSVPESTPNESLVIGINENNLPWAFTDESGQIVGFEVDLAEAIAESLEVDIELVELPFTELFPAAASGRIDLAMASITVTEERMKTVAFSQPYYDSDQSLIVKVGGDINGLENLTGKVIAVESGTTGELWVNDHQERYQIADIVRDEENLEAIMGDVASGRVDGFIADIPFALYYTKTHPELEVIERIPTGEQYAFMFSQTNPLRDEVNAVITQLKEDGSMAEIHKKWFGKEPDPQSSTVVVLPIPNGSQR